MTVAAVILAASPAVALADAEGTPAVRRIADAAWAGGATPVVVVAEDPAGAVAAALATAEVTLVAPGTGDGEPAQRVARGMAAAGELVGSTTAALVWPARVAWADAETVTTLIHTHGDDPGAILRPAYGGVAGWPALVPVDALGALSEISASGQPDEILDALAAAGFAVHTLDTGDPGTTHDVSVPQAALPPFDGPPRPDDDVEREWGAPAADQPDDAPPAGPARLAATDPAS
ncbi:MAG TPA: NTP transferase domain-containing protein [Candidatus Limnocylindrales bacterium]